MSKPLPKPQPPLTRKHIFSVRLTSPERQAIRDLAKQMKVSPSHLVRHFVMQAVSYYQQEA
jgi:hypothetical protein